MSAFITAQKARELTFNKPQQRAQITAIKTQLDEAVQKAISSGIPRASIRLSEDVDPILVNGLKRALTKLGFRVKVEHRLGEFNPNFLVLPKTILTLNW